MKKSFILFLALASVSIAGTIKDPEYIKNGEVHGYGADSNQNIFYFYMESRGNFYIKAQKANTKLENVFMKPVITIYDNQMRKICKTNYGQYELNCALTKGKHYIQIESQQTTGQFTTFAENMKEKEPKITIKFKD
ncbi:MAG TPA: hypothetical protein PKW30_01580 [Campylobacterales bacterium]|nr:hypothetical protein [Campylobacterales bacterium]